MASFYPRARGGRDFGQFLTSRHPNVSIHAPAGGATATSARVCRAYCVSIHAPAGGATSGRSYSQPAGTMVSIHAPAGGATDLQLDAYNKAQVSIHAPAGGATRGMAAAAAADMFLSTRPRGARLIQGVDLAAPAIVSIHAPAGGATWRGGMRLSPTASFYPRARGGRDSSILRD